jgi:hypothetical protein
MDDQQQEGVEPRPEDQSVEDFKREVEDDPSTASETEKDSTDLDRLRGG